MAQWLLLIGRAPFPDAERLDPASLAPIAPPPDRFWADPFIWSRDGRCWVFVEELPFDTRIGRISVLELDDSLRAHGTLDARARRAETSVLSIPVRVLGRALHGPGERGQRAHRLLSLRRVSHPLDPRAEPDDRVEGRRRHPVRARRALVAPVLRAGAGAHINGSLFAFHADQPLTDRWTPHPGNPLVRDFSRGRPGGRVLRQGRRPADSSRPGFGAPLRSRAAPDGDRAADPRWIRGAGDLARYGSQLRGLARHASSGLARGDPGHGRPAPAPP